MTGVPSRQRWAPYVLCAPFMLVFLAFMAYPMVQSILLAAQQTYGPGAGTYVGAANFHHLWQDPLFTRALLNTTVFAAGSLFIQLPCALGLALLLNRPNLRGRAIFRLIYFSPALVGLTFVAIIFGLVFEKRTGLLNVLLFKTFGFDIEFAWLEEHIMPSLIIAAFWQYVGFNMVYFLAALQNVPRQLTEAAVIDGAGPWSRFFHVTLPAIRPVAGFVVLLSLVGSFQLFELPYLLLDGPGPDNRGLTLVIYLYQTGFERGDLGYASTIAWVLAIVLGFFALGYRRLTRSAE